MNNKKVQFITRTAAILAITVVFQLLRVIIPGLGALPSSVYIIGSLVNLGLLLGVSIVGISGGLIIACITPIIALLTAHIMNPYQLVLVAAGNVSLVLVYGLLSKHILLFKNKIVSNSISVVVGALIKFAVMYFGATLVAKMLLSNADFQKVFALAQTFQLITALIGGALMLLIMPALKKAIKI